MKVAAFRARAKVESRESGSAFTREGTSGLLGYGSAPVPGAKFTSRAVAFSEA